MLINRLFWSSFTAFHLRKQGDLPYWPLARIEKERDRRAMQMVAHAYRYVPYYRKTMRQLGLLPSDFCGAADIEKLPMIDRHQIQHHWKDFLSQSKSANSYLEVSSGGSSGAPVKIHHDIRSLFMNAAHGERDRSPYRSLLDKPTAYRETLFSPGAFGTAYNVQKFCRKHAYYPKNMRIIRQYLSLFDPPEKNLPKLNAFKPDIVRSYGSYLEMLFNHIDKTGDDLHRPKVIVFGGDGISSANRNEIETKYNLPVFSIYGAVEALKIGFECECHTGLHVNIDLYPLKIVDEQGKSLPNGQIGHVVLSNLINRSTVLLNYRLGDRAALLDVECPCGRTLPLLSFPDGRMDDLIRLPRGRICHPQAIRTIFTKESAVGQYQVVQQTQTHFSVKIIAKKQSEHILLKKSVARKFSEKFGNGITVDVSFVDTLERTPSGKLIPVISKIGQPQN